MKKLLLFLMLGCVHLVHAQEGEFESISFGKDLFRLDSLPKPLVREVVSGTIIQVQYEGEEWEQNLERKNAFEHACRILEEQIPRALPLKVKVKFGKLRGNNEIAKTIIYTDICYWHRNSDGRVPRTSIKWALANGRDKTSMDNLTMDFFKSLDGEITFSEDEIYSYSLDHVADNKYDFITVSLRELCKIMGFCFTIRGDNVNKVLDISEDNLLSFDKLFVSLYPLDPQGDYNRAVSGNVTIDFGFPSRFPYKIYSPSIFENGRSLSYFEINEANNETKLMQPDLPRGTSIRYVGAWFRKFLEAIGWKHDLIVGEHKDFGGDGSPTSTDKMIPYGEDVSFTTMSSNSGNRTTASAHAPQSSANFAFSNISVNEYIWQFEIYPVINSDPLSPLLGISISILRKDGTWDMIKKQGLNWDSNIQFSFSDIDPTKVSEYIRSSDGYLRCKLARYDFDAIAGRDVPNCKTFARYFLVDYLPQKPQMAFSKVMPQTRSNDNEYYVDVKIAFKDIEGTESILVEQLEEGAQVPFTYFVENVKNGYFIATVDKEYSTTFKLRAMNKNGETISEQLILSPIAPAAPHTLRHRIIDNSLLLELGNSRKEITHTKIATYKIVNLSNSTTVESGKVLNNTVDISSLKSGFYAIEVLDEETKSYSAKFTK